MADLYVSRASILYALVLPVRVYIRGEHLCSCTAVAAEFPQLKIAASEKPQTTHTTSLHIPLRPI